MTTVLITGTSTGIGRETALFLARKGYDVFATMRSPDKSDLADIAKAENLPVTVLQQDVTDESSNQVAVDAVVDAKGAIDVLINNAGIGGANVTEEMSMQHMRDVFDTNVFGAVDLTKRVIPSMRERRSGAIINVTSVAGRMSVSPQIAYSGSKVALDAITEMWSQELSPFGVRVAAIEPGIIITPILEKFELPDPNTHYARNYERMMVFFEAGIKVGTGPELVADAILNAIETDAPRLRYLVGGDAEGIMRMRELLSDEEWVGLFAGDMTIEEFKSQASKLTGLSL